MSDNTIDEIERELQEAADAVEQYMRENAPEVAEEVLTRLGARFDGISRLLKKLRAEIG